VNLHLGYFDAFRSLHDSNDNGAVPDILAQWIAEASDGEKAIKQS
jgi:hypothetical protein